MKLVHQGLLLSIIVVLVVASISVAVSASSSNLSSSTVSPATKVTVTDLTNQQLPPTVSDKAPGTAQVSRTTSLVGTTATVYWDTVDPPSGATDVSVQPTMNLTFHATACNAFSNPGWWFWVSNNPNDNCQSHKMNFQTVHANERCYSNGAIGNVTLTDLGHGGNVISLDPLTTYYLFVQDPNGGCVQLANFTTKDSFWSAWTNLGGQLLEGTSPAAYSSGGATGWFVTGTNHQLYWSTGSGYTSLGGYLTSSPAAASSVSGVIDVFARGSNGVLYSRHYQGGTWGPWTNLGGQLLEGTSPAAYSSGGATGWFVTGTNHQLYWSTSPGSWTNLGGYLTSSPAAYSAFSGNIHVYVRGTNGACYWKHTANGGASWSGWTSIGGQIAPNTGPGASSWPSRLDVFVQGTTGALYHKWIAPNMWSIWENLGGQLTASPSATSPFQGRIDVYARGSDGAVWWRYREGL